MEANETVLEECKDLKIVEELKARVEANEKTLKIINEGMKNLMVICMKVSASTGALVSVLSEEELEIFKKTYDKIIESSASSLSSEKRDNA